MTRSPMLTDAALEAADSAAFQAQSYTLESIRAFLAAQDRDALAQIVARTLADASRGELALYAEEAADVVTALLGEESS